MPYPAKRSRTALSIECILAWLQITEKDEEVLEHLIDIQVEELGSPADGHEEGDEEEEEEDEECGFRLVFTFAPNDFFSETVLVRPPARPCLHSQQCAVVRF